jgi:large subunit ribosomal protein L6
MSRIGKKPIKVPKAVDVNVEGDVLSVKGPKGTLKQKLQPNVEIKVDKGEICFLIADQTAESRSLHGLYRSLCANMVHGVDQGFEKALDIVGVGYRAELKGKVAVFSLGYSHPIEFPLPEGIDARIDKTRIILSGADKQLVGLTAAKIRSLRKPEPYKGKGIKYVDEVIRRKAGKSGAK